MQDMTDIMPSKTENNDFYLELQIKINPDIEDIVSEICFEMLPCEGVVLAEETYKDLEMVSTTEGTLKVFLYDNGISEDEIRAILAEQRNILKSRSFSDDELGSWNLSLQKKENQDWSKKWKEKWDVTHVSDRITVVPDWIEYSPLRKDEVVIRLEPGCAFGTGTHQTTQLCMKVIEKYMSKGAKMADIGTGSGILAICAAKFGASEVYGCDNDPTVIDVAKENAVKNNIELASRPMREMVEFHSEPGELRNSGEGCYRFELNTADMITEKFDFVCANILHNVLAEIMPDLKNIMKNNAIMVLSGILNEKKPVVIEAVEKCRLKIIEEMHQDQWVALIVKNVEGCY